MYKTKIVISTISIKALLESVGLDNSIKNENINREIPIQYVDGSVLA